jgi:hypothetical protein
MDMHRFEINFIESLYTLVILVLTIVALGLNILGSMTGLAIPFYYTPPFAGCVTGLVMKAAVLIHRKGGWLKKKGDEWEEAKDRHKPTHYLIPWAQILILQPILGLSAQAEYIVWQDLASSPILQVTYAIGTGVLISAGVLGYIVAAIKAKEGF